MVLVVGVAAASGLRTQVKLLLLLLLFFSLLTVDPLVLFHVDAEAGVADDPNPCLVVVGVASPPLLLPNVKPIIGSVDQ